MRPHATMLSAFAISDDESVFARLVDPSVRLAVWTRPNPCRPGDFPVYAEPAGEALASLPSWLSDDIAQLAELHRDLTGGSDWRVRLETATERICPAFHEDGVRLRLLVTYRGPGTEWTTDAPAGPIHRIPTGAVAAFKGSAWPSMERLLHRSAKASRRKPRWMLAMDAGNASSGVIHSPRQQQALPA